MDVAWYGAVFDQAEEVFPILAFSDTYSPMKVDNCHLQLIWASKSGLQRLNESSQFTKDERYLSYLPLSHVAALSMDVYSAINNDVTVFFAQPNALKVRRND